MPVIAVSVQCIQTPSEFARQSTLLSLLAWAADCKVICLRTHTFPPSPLAKFDMTIRGLGLPNCIRHRFFPRKPNPLYTLYQGMLCQQMAGTWCPSRQWYSSSIEPAADEGGRAAAPSGGAFARRLLVRGTKKRRKEREMGWRGTDYHAKAMRFHGSALVL